MCLVLSYVGSSSSDVLFFVFLQVHPRMGVLSLEFVLDRRCSLLMDLSSIIRYLTAWCPHIILNEIQYLVFSKHGRENPEWNFCKESDVVFIISILYLVNFPSRCCYRQILIAEHDANPWYGLTISVSVKVPRGRSLKSQVCCILTSPMEVLSGLLTGRLIPQWVTYCPQMILPKGFSSPDTLSWSWGTSLLTAPTVDISLPPQLESWWVTVEFFFKCPLLVPQWIIVQHDRSPRYHLLSRVIW